MIKKLNTCLLSGVLGVLMLSAGTTAQASETLPIAANIGVYSQYLLRSVPQGAGKLSIQGDVGVSLSDGLAVSAWFATGAGADTGTDIEYDFILDYSGEAYGIDYSLGFFTIAYRDAVEDKGGEFYLSAAYDIFSAAVYVAETYVYHELGAAYTIADMVDASLMVGFDNSSHKADVAVSLSKELEMGRYLISPSFAVAKLVGADTEFVLGLDASF